MNGPMGYKTHRALPGGCGGMKKPGLVAPAGFLCSPLFDFRSPLLPGTVRSLVSPAIASGKSSYVPAFWLRIAGYRILSFSYFFVIQVLIFGNRTHPQSSEKSFEKSS